MQESQPTHKSTKKITK